MVENKKDCVYMDKVMDSLKSNFVDYKRSGPIQVKNIYDLVQFYSTQKNLGFEGRRGIVLDILDNLKKLSDREISIYGLNTYKSHLSFLLNPKSAIDDVSFLVKEIGDEENLQLKGLVASIKKFQDQKRVGILGEVHVGISENILNQMRRGDGAGYRHIENLLEARKNLDQKFPYLSN